MFHILQGKSVSSLETTACADLKVDLEKTTGQSVQIVPIEDPTGTPKDILASALPELASSDVIIIVGCPETNPVIQAWSQADLIPVSGEKPGKRGGIVHMLKAAKGFHPEIQEVVILAGSDPQGTQYAVYDFSRYDLGVDPFEYWTGIPSAPVEFQATKVRSRVIEPPAVPILAYFDNDNDELANITDPFLEFSFEHWQEIIKSLVRLKYNAIDLHDHFGRAEFYRWPHYKKLRPDYEPNVKLLDAVIDYAHERGVMIQVSFYLGWKFRVISDKASLNWPKYKQEWIDVWTYYLEQTPIGKCDIFLNRPRDQRWDRKYRGKGLGNDPVSVFNEAFPAMYQVIKNHNPDAIVVIDLYSEGRAVFRDGLRPEPKNGYIMVWPDNGFGEFAYFPEDLAGYQFGIYMHAGFYLNHVVQDPYPEFLAESMKPALIDHGMDSYCLVNGQTFRHYLLNLEACSRICETPESFDADQFYQEWVARYFGETNAAEIVGVLRSLHHAQVGHFGYINIMARLIGCVWKNRVAKLHLIPRKYLNFISEKFWKMGEIFNEVTERNVELLGNALETCKTIIFSDPASATFFHDFVLLQVKLLYQLNQIAFHLQRAGLGSEKQMHLEQAIKWIRKHHQARIDGDNDPKWGGWYNPETRRPNGGYFDMKTLEEKHKIRVKHYR